MSATRSNAPKAPVTRTAWEPAWPDTALLLCAHGIRGHPGAAIEHAARLQERGLFAEVHACAYRGMPDLAETLAAIRAPNICLAPLLMAEGFTLRMMLHKVGRHNQSRLAVCRPIGTHAKLAEVMADMAQGACVAQDWAPRETALLVVGHGTVRHPDSGLTARRHATHIAATNKFREVAVAFLDELPGIDEALAGLASSHCVVVGLFIDRGEHGEADIPRALATGDHPAIYAGPVGSDPRVTDLLLDQVRRALSPLAA